MTMYRDQPQSLPKINEVRFLFPMNECRIRELGILVRHCEKLLRQRHVQKSILAIQFAAYGRSQFAEVMVAPISGTVGDENETGAALPWGRERPRFLHGNLGSSLL